MLKYGKHSQSETRNLRSSSCLSQNAAVSQNIADNPNCPSSDSHRSQSFLSCNLPQKQGFSHDSARHFTSPPRPLNSQRPTELCLSAPNIPPSRQHCKTRPVAQTHSPTSSPLARSPPFHHSSSPSPPSNTRTDCTIFPPWSLYDGSDLTLLNHCLHHIISLRNSSPNLSNPANNQGNFGGNVSAILDNRDRSQSINVPLRFNPSQDRSSLSSYDIKGRPSLLVG